MPRPAFYDRLVADSPMERKASPVDRFGSNATGKSYLRLQFITLVQLVRGEKLTIPPVDTATAFRAVADEAENEQRTLL